MEDLELKKIIEKSRLFNQFLIDRVGMPAQLFEETDRQMEKAYAEKNIKALKAADDSINEEVKHLSLKHALEIKKILKERLGIDFEVVEKLRLKTIDKILKRGKIKTPEEYELLNNRVDEILADPSKSEEMAKIDKMLSNYGGT